MNQSQITLCASSTYDQKYYFNEDFSGIPQQIQNELKVISIVFTEQISCVFRIVFEEDGKLDLVVEPQEDDYAYDEIGSALKIKDLQRNKQELWESLELYYQVFLLGEPKIEE